MSSLLQRTPRRTWITTLALALSFTGALGGCAHYRLGTGSDAHGLATLYIAPVTDEAVVPQAVAVVTRELRLAFLRDGRLRLVQSPEDADATLEVTLTNYGRTMTSARPEDTGLARKFDLALVARATLTDHRNGSVRLEAQPLTATRQIFTDGDGFRLDGRAAPGGQLPAEYQTLPLLAQQLADRALHAVLDTW